MAVFPRRETEIFIEIAEKSEYSHTVWMNAYDRILGSFPSDEQDSIWTWLLDNQRIFHWNPMHMVSLLIIARSSGIK